MQEMTLHSPRCSQCGTEISLGTKFCTNCGFPENGTEKEQSKFHAQKILKKSRISEDKNKVESARKTLYWMAGIFFVFGLFYFFITQDLSLLIVNSILAIIYLVLAYWSQTKPFAALLSALLLYIMVIALNGIVEPLSLVKGIIIKIVIISFLIKGIYSASPGVKIEN